MFEKSYKYQKEIKTTFSPTESGVLFSNASELQKAFLKSDIIALIFENVHLL